MLRGYRCESGQLVVALEGPGPAPGPLVWIDLFEPTAEEDKFVEQLLGINLPTLEEMKEIEVSARLYQEGGAEFMTLTAISQLETDDPSTAPITFVLKGNTLLTVRYAQIKAFSHFMARSAKPNAVVCSGGEQIMMSLIEAICDRLADALEQVGFHVDTLSRAVFRRKSRSTASRTTQELQLVIEKIGQDGDLLTKVRECLISINRVLTYHNSGGTGSSEKQLSKEARVRAKVLYRDVVALSDQAAFLSNKINFLLDATLGLIGLQQNQIIKIFSVAAVVFLPPTLIASIYGMNFDYMPELKWLLGYPWAIGLMILSAIVPYFYFKRRGWL